MVRSRFLTRAVPLVALCAMVPGCSSFEKRVAEVESRQDALDAQISDLQAAQQNIVARLVQLRQELENWTTFSAAVSRVVSGS